MTVLLTDERGNFAGRLEKRPGKLAVALLLAAVLGMAPNPGVSASAADEPGELLATRAKYERDVEQALRPLKERYLQALDKIKRSLTFKGDLAGALAVQQEMDSIGSGPGLARLAGDWVCRFANGAIHHYTIEADGAVFWTDPAPKKKLKTTMRGKDFLVEFPDDDILERIVVSGSELQIEHFSPKAGYPQGPAATRGVGKRATAIK